MSQYEYLKDMIIETLREKTPRIIDRELPHNLTIGQGRCLPASRIGLETFAYFGIDAKPLIMGAVSANREWVEWMDATEGKTEMPDEAWSVGIDPVDRGNGFAGHMVVKVDDHLLDLDARQFARENHGIFVPETIYEPLADDDSLNLDLPEDGMLCYVKHVRPPRWQHATDWKIARTWAGEVIREIKGVASAVHVS